MWLQLRGEMTPGDEALLAGLVAAKSEQHANTTTSANAHLEPFTRSPHNSLAIDTDISLARNLLEKYSRIPPTQIEPHIQTIIAKACQLPDPYPCITRGRFLQFEGSQHPLFNTILSRLTESNQTLLDLGCCFGQDVRYYVYCGAPPSGLYGLDLHPEFFELGFELFNDRATIDDHFIAGDILAARGSSDLDKFEGKMDMISAIAFLHLFSWEEQVTACMRMIRFLRPFDANDFHRQVIFGRQTASLEPGIIVRENVKWERKELFMHDLSTFEKLWRLE